MTTTTTNSKPKNEAMTTSSSSSSSSFSHYRKKRGHCCVDIWKLPRELLEIKNKEEKLEYIHQLAQSTDVGIPFPPNSLTTPAPISFLEEAAVVLGLSIALGGPLVWVCTMMTLVLVGSWYALFVATIVSLILAFHPMPSNETSTQYVMNSWFTRSLYKYFTYRFVWTGNAHIKSEEAQPWIGAGPPHGVMPFANVLSIPAINSIASIPFVGCPASVVFHTPFLRYLTLFPSIPVTGSSIQKATDEAGVCVGIVPDGIAGIFRQCPHKEYVALKDRRGLARHALKTGTNILPAYSFGNTAAFCSWWDSFGILEWCSRKAQASIFLYWGRFFLPIPIRCQITMVFGDPILVEKVVGDHPTQEQINELHEKILAGIRKCYEDHKAALGWGDKELVFV